LTDGQPQRDHWFETLADHLGGAYLRYSFTKGTDQEVTFLHEVLNLEPGMRLLDVGCGPGRHSRALAAMGIEVVGVDISQRFIDLARVDAPPGATFERRDARSLTFDREFDAVISLCQGAFGLADGGSVPVVLDPDAAVLAGMARALRPGGRLVLSAFSAYFQVYPSTSCPPRRDPLVRPVDPQSRHQARSTYPARSPSTIVEDGQIVERHGRQGRQGRGPARHRLQVRGCHPQP
jgi:SAM-dependent methyltransferase